MTKYKAIISARKEGAIGIHSTEHRIYEIEANDLDQLHKLAIDRAYQEGGIEHIKVVRVEPLNTAARVG